MVYLSIKNLRLKYQNAYILDGLSLNVMSGELLVILGESGCGKSSLLKAIAGILTPDSGEIWLNEQNITAFSPKERKMGYVPQAQVLFPHLTIRENIAFGLRAQKWEKEEIARQVLAIARLVQVEDFLDRLPSEISGGQKQRVALARAMAIEPALLLLDEPLSSIDASGREQLAFLIRRIQQETRTTILYVTHNQEEARLLADRVAIIFDGKVQQIGTVDEVARVPKNYKIAQILGIRNIWEVRLHFLSEQTSQIESNFGTFSVSQGALQEVTGMLLPTEAIEVTPYGSDGEKSLETSQLDHDFLIFQGMVQSIHHTRADVPVLIVKITGLQSEFLRVQPPSLISPFSDGLKFSPGQRIGLRIRKNKLVFF